MLPVSPGSMTYHWVKLLFDYGSGSVPKKDDDQIIQNEKYKLLFVEMSDPNNLLRINLFDRCYYLQNLPSRLRGYTIEKRHPQNGSTVAFDLRCTDDQSYAILIVSGGCAGDFDWFKEKFGIDVLKLIPEVHGKKLRKIQSEMEKRGTELVREEIYHEGQCDGYFSWVICRGDPAKLVGLGKVMND